MATITAITMSSPETITNAAFTATESGGDVLAIGTTNADVLIEFANDAGGAVTPTIANVTAASVTVQPYGLVQKADISASIAASGYRAVLIKRAQLSQYLNGSNQIALTYASHDVAFKVRAIVIP